jgi:hypothetical protein
MTSDEIIEKISDIRVRNNRLWMELLKIAMQADPVRAKPILRDITHNDHAVTLLTDELSK